MVRSKSKSESVFNIIKWIIMLLVIIITVYPMYYVLVCSFSDGNQLIGARGLILSPRGFSLEAYKAVIQNPNIFTGYRVTLFVVIVGTILSVFTTSVGAYIATRKDFKFGKFLTLMMVFTMYFGGGMIPTYLVVSNTLNLGDSLFALIFPGMISVYNLLIMKSNFEALPESLTEAAKIDGANDIRILFQIIMPLSKSVIAVMVLFYGVAYWNAWFEAMMYIKSRELFPLQLILREILVSNDTSSMGVSGGVGEQYMIGECIKYATIVVATVPVLCIYPFVQKYFVKGMMIGAVKG